MLETKYYRYDSAKLQFVFEGPSFDRLAAAVSNPLTASNEDVAPYADYQFTWGGLGVASETVQGAGCSSCSGGLGTYTYTYALTVPHIGFGLNGWWRKTIEELPDGNSNIVYTNTQGLIVLQVYHDAVTEQEWATYYHYDSEGRVVWVAYPSAVSGYDEDYGDLLHDVDGNYEFLNDDTGLIQTSTFATETTATSSTAGDVADYFVAAAIQRGELGTPVPQEAVQYISHTDANGVTVYPVASATVYRNDDGSGEQTTTYDYTWFTDTNKQQSRTVTYPVVTSSQNGPDTPDTVTEVYDTYGRPIWRKDADGFLHYMAYDPATGAVVKTITDVDTEETGDFTALPSGWETPAGGGLHLITTMEVDGLGRTTKLTAPNGNVTYTVYNDPDHEIRVYAGWDTTTDAPTGPTRVVREDRANGYTERLTMSAEPDLDGSDLPTGEEAIDNLQSLRREYRNAAGQVVRADAYFNLDGLTYDTDPYIGTQNTHFYTTLYDYEARGRLERTELPTGTIERRVYDGLSRLVSRWVGTDDIPESGSWSPTNPANLVQVVGATYDNDGVGDGNLTELTVYPGGGAADRVTQLFYDWRNRPAAIKQGVEEDEATAVNRPLLYLTYDNGRLPVSESQYDGDDVLVEDDDEDGVPDAPAASLLRTYRTVSYDDQGRAFRMDIYSVDPSNGDISEDSLHTDVWYNHRGFEIKRAKPGGLVTKLTYNGAGRKVTTYQSDGGSDSGWNDADDVSGDAVLSQTEQEYDDNGNVILTVTRDRFHDETATGVLADATTTPKARVSYVATYYDAINRMTDVVNVGTNGGSTYTRPGTLPSRSDTVLVSSYEYDAAGHLETMTDPRGLLTKEYHDALGRTTTTIEAYTDGTPTDDTDKTTEYTYDGSGHVLTLTTLLPDDVHQTTQFVYGVSSDHDSAINSNDFLAAMRYPDPETGDPSEDEEEVYTVNALGERTTLTDRNGTMHTYSRDVVGRSTADAVTTLGEGLDDSVLRIETAYDTAGRPYLATSYDAATAGDVVNQVQQAYNGLGQLVTEYQAHAGAVNTSTTPKVQYTYSEMASGANHSRLVSMTYPNGRELNYNYTSGLDSAISRLSSLSDSSSTLEAYSYLGLNTVVTRAHPEPDIDLTYVKRSGESNGDAGDPYTGLDRFGRVVDQRWLDPSTGTATDRFEYGYDADGSRLYRKNLVNAAFSELYHANGATAGYDDLKQLVAFARGTLSDTNSDSVPDTVASPSRSQSWAFDALGNWTTVTTDTVEQDRTHNLQNEITSVESLTTPAYDANGNLTTDESDRTLVYDAWNRLVAVKSGSTTLVSYGYDALRRRVVEDNSTARDLYYSTAWQVLEEREDGDAIVQYVWSAVYVDGLVLRDRDTDANTTLDERLYVQQDANWNVTAVVDDTGAVQERYVYDPYGKASILAPDWSARGTSSLAWHYLHQGGRYDSDSGLYDFRNREFSPTLGRWLQNDPVLFQAGDNNLYRYVANGPATFLDPTGLAIPKGLPIYGNYCGPGNLAGDPMGEVDACCKDHDDCYKNKNCQLNNGLPGYGTKASLGCDADLIGCLKKATCKDAMMPKVCEAFKEVAIQYFSMNIAIAEYQALIQSLVDQIKKAVSKN